MSEKMIGAVLYEGPSEIDGSPIVAIMTGFQGSANRKTGKMLQTWIIRADVDPGTAAQTGIDGAICGNCPQRRSTGGACYVVVEQGPLAVYDAWKRGRYVDWTKSFPHNVLRGKAVRFGAYGDPAAVPVNVWRRVRSQKLANWTGYTHQWRKNPQLRPFLMASVDSEAEMFEAQSKGWRTFRVHDAGEPTILDREVICPSDRVSCVTCGLCKGSSMVAKSVTIAAHGYLIGRRKPKALPVAG